MKKISLFVLSTIMFTHSATAATVILTSDVLKKLGTVEVTSITPNNGTVSCTFLGNPCEKPQKVPMNDNITLEVKTQFSQAVNVIYTVGKTNCSFSFQLSGSSQTIQNNFSKGKNSATGKDCIPN